MARTDTTKDSIKPIETVYNGYRFRSRLEARWAVFFDTAGIEYQYEPEGYELPSGRYLPDFYLPKVGRWIEVKKPPGPSKDELDRLLDFGVEKYAKLGENVTILVGEIPDTSPIPTWTFTLVPPNEGIVSFVPPEYDQGGWVDANDLLKFMRMVPRNDIHHEFKLRVKNEEIAYPDPSLFGFIRHGHWMPSSRNVGEALIAARQARFEHGERPRPRKR